MTIPPYWALSLIYWLHMLSTITWIGSLAALSLLILPAVSRLDDPGYAARLLGNIQKRLDPLSWASMLILVGTGLFQMSANPNYQGFLAINNRWAVAMLLKHLIFLVMIVLSASMTWGLLPALTRTALRKAHGLDTGDDEKLRRREANLLRMNLILGVCVLALTAMARSS